MADTKRVLLAVVCPVLALAAPAAYAQQSAGQISEEAIADNAEMAAIFAADQAARTGTAIDWEVVAREDAARAVRVREMLDAGELRTGNDFWAASFIFQHGGGPKDYLLAHVMAVHAVSLGSERARWIAAATLDRYLQSTGADQVYGTQYRAAPGEPVTMEPYDTGLLTDAIRLQAQVPPLAHQEARRAEIEAEVLAAAAGESDGN